MTPITLPTLENDRLKYSFEMLIDFRGFIFAAVGGGPRSANQVKAADYHD